MSLSIGGIVAAFPLGAILGALLEPRFRLVTVCREKQTSRRRR